eukprot:TRINITY_DN16584_c0_g1_i2.p1 TRINITY_DN16584_c0_g1~~TRINITY_DN16584_c0_g1_i2.p1  ORF type:complete len:119 (+),score=42.61 TRINITY_DN16584_c0_g1_i2:112-468(+)
MCIRDRMMFDAFIKLGSLPGATRAWVGHEYTVSNMSYAKFVEPENPEVLRKLEWSQETVAQGGMTTPTTIQDEHAFNPFMRAAFQVESVMQHCNTSDPVDAIKFVRAEKSAGTWKSKI